MVPLDVLGVCGICQIQLSLVPWLLQHSCSMHLVYLCCLCLVLRHGDACPPLHVILPGLTQSTFALCLLHPVLVTSLALAVELNMNHVYFVVFMLTRRASKGHKRISTLLGTYLRSHALLRRGGTAWEFHSKHLNLPIFTTSVHDYNLYWMGPSG